MLNPVQEFVGSTYCISISLHGRKSDGFLSDYQYKSFRDFLRMTLLGETHSMRYISGSYMLGLAINMTFSGGNCYSQQQSTNKVHKKKHVVFCKICPAFQKRSKHTLGDSLVKIKKHQAILCDLFGMVKT